jgi:exopolysaccharide production protein ExoQ
MSSNGHPPAKPAPRVRRNPGLLFLFLAVVFFLCEHDLRYSLKSVNAFNPSEDDLVTAVGEGSIIRRVSLFSLGLFAIVSLIRGSANGEFRISGGLGWILLGFAALSFLSLIWSEDTALTFRRLVTFGILAGAAAAIARRLSLREMMLWTFFSSLLFLVIGVSAEVLLGTFHPFESGYRYSGTLHPNHQGINCALLLLSAVAAASVEKGRRVFFGGCAVAAFIFLMLSGSRTSFAAAVLALGMYSAITCSSRWKIVIAYALSVAFCILTMVLGNALLPDIKSALMLGRDDASTASMFNGRAGIWEDVSKYIAKRPLLGYGFGGFWTPKRISVISSEENWGTAEGHSSYLDCLLSLGLVGLVTFLFAIFGGIGRSLLVHRATRNTVFAFSAALLTFCAVNGLLESAVLGSPSLTFITFTILIQLGFRVPQRHDFAGQRGLIKRPAMG